MEISFFKFKIITYSTPKQVILGISEIQSVRNDKMIILFYESLGTWQSGQYFAS